MPAKNAKNNYAPSLGLYETKAGTGYQTKVTPNVYDTLQKATIGCRLFVREIPAERRAKIKSENKPAYELIVLPPSEVSSRDADV